MSYWILETERENYQLVPILATKNLILDFNGFHLIKKKLLFVCYLVFTLSKMVNLNSINFINLIWFLGFYLFLDYLNLLMGLFEYLGFFLSVCWSEKMLEDDFSSMKYFCSNFSIIVWLISRNINDYSSISRNAVDPSSILFF
jgi:hypothetical protein